MNDTEDKETQGLKQNQVGKDRKSLTVFMLLEMKPGNSLGDCFELIEDLFVRGADRWLRHMGVGVITSSEAGLFFISTVIHHLVFEFFGWRCPGLTGFYVLNLDCPFISFHTISM